MIPIRSPGNAFVEGDASSASYFLAGAAVTGGTMTVEGCGTSSLQVFMVFSYFMAFIVPFLIQCMSFIVLTPKN